MVLRGGMARLTFILNGLLWLVCCSQFTEESTVEARDSCAGSEVIQLGDEDGSDQGGSRIDCEKGSDLPTIQLTRKILSNL